MHPSRTLTGESYLDLLARIHSECPPRTYLEIGVGRGMSLTLARNSAVAVGIDPNPVIAAPLPPAARLFRETSDEFFARHDLHAELSGLPLDLAFIDGMHLFEYALRDFVYIERNSAPGTVVLVHDCYPIDAVTSARERTTEFWAGDVWKLIVCLAKYRPDLDIRTLAAQPTGLAVIRGLDRDSRLLQERFGELLSEFVPVPYDAIHADKDRLLRLVPGDWPTLHAALSTSEAAILNNRGVALAEMGRWNDAAQLYRRALAIDPRHALAYNNLGNALRQVGGIVESERCYRQALALRPDLPQGHNHLGNALRDLGRLEEAEQSYRQALALPQAWNNLVFLLNYLPERSAAQIHAEHVEFGRRFGAFEHQPHRNDPDAKRKLRIGYVSGDLRDHAVAHFLEPVLGAHDRRNFEIHCYSNSLTGDATTLRLKACVDGWRDIAAIDDEALANRIREDRIDVLVDLSGHTAGNRLLAFARKPAPVQASWLGYLNTTGLAAMDYRITDPRVAPEGMFEAVHSERLVRLPDSQWCYRQPEDSPEPDEPSGPFTFGVFTNPPKVNRTVAALWAKLLERVPGSRLLLQLGILGSIPEDYVDRLVNAGLPRERITVLPRQPRRDYLELHRSAHLILDTFPVPGGTATCDSLWMGVPVVTLAGETIYSRGGASLLHAVGLEELIAGTPEQYVEIAATLAGKPKRLAKLRKGLRGRMSASPLMDAKRFTRNLEKAFRDMWQTWCENPR